MFACPIKKVIETAKGQIRLYDFSCFAKQYPGVSNVLLVDAQEQVQWHAELPEDNELYIGMGHDTQGIWCGTANYVVCTIDLETGKMIDKKTIQ